MVELLGAVVAQRCEAGGETRFPSWNSRRSARGALAHVPLGTGCISMTCRRCREKYILSAYLTFSTPQAHPQNRSPSAEVRQQHRQSWLENGRWPASGRRLVDSPAAPPAVASADGPVAGVGGGREHRVVPRQLQEFGDASPRREMATKFHISLRAPSGDSRPRARTRSRRSCGSPVSRRKNSAQHGEIRRAKCCIAAQMTSKG